MLNYFFHFDFLCKCSLDDYFVFFFTSTRPEAVNNTSSCVVIILIEICWAVILDKFSEVKLLVNM